MINYREIPNPPRLISLRRRFLIRLLEALRGNRLYFNPQQFESEVTNKGTWFALKRNTSTGAAFSRFAVSALADGQGNFNDTITIGEGTLYAPTNVGTNVPAGDSDPETILMLPSAATRHEFPPDTFPVTLSAIAGDDVYLTLTWTLRVEDMGNDDTPGANITLLQFWELTSVNFETGTRPAPVFDWNLGTATTYWPLATLEGEGDNVDVVQHFLGDIFVSVPVVSDRSLVPNTTSGGGSDGSNQGTPAATVTIERAATVDADFVSQLDVDGQSCRQVSSKKRTIYYQPKKFTFSNGTVTEEVFVSEVQVSLARGETTVGSFANCENSGL